MFGSTRLDPTTAATRRQCEYVAETDPAVLKVLLKVSRPGGLPMGRVRRLRRGWQVPHYAESVG